MEYTKNLELPLPAETDTPHDSVFTFRKALGGIDSAIGTDRAAAEAAKSETESQISAVGAKLINIEKDQQGMWDILDAKAKTLESTESGELSVSVALVESMLLERSKREHPVGSYYTSDKDTEPAEIFGFGTWERVKGVFLLGADDKTYLAGSEGGEAEHTLTLAESVKHGHNVYVYTGSNPSDGMEAHHWSADGTTAEVAPNGATFSHTWCSSSFKSWGATTMTGGGDPAGTTNALGGSQPHNNMPPYHAAYCWRRTA